MFSKQISIAALALLSGNVNAWWGEGHLLVARIAQDILEKESPQTVKDVERVLDILKKSDPGWTKSEGEHPMVECATFADDIKFKGGSYQSMWHFIDQPFLDDGGKINDYPEFKIEDYTVINAINEITQWLQGASGYKSTAAYKAIMEHGFKGHTEADAASTALRLLIHYVGDIHQPLHASSRVDKAYPEGDRGGNSFHIKPQDGAKNLHGVWDSVLFEFDGRPTLPLESSAWSKLGSEADKLRSSASASAGSMDPQSWADESLEIVNDVVYKNVEEDGEVSQEYLNKAKPLAEKQLVKAGERLAALLKTLKLDQHAGKTENTEETGDSEKTNDDEWQTVAHHTRSHDEVKAKLEKFLY